MLRKIVTSIILCFFSIAIWATPVTSQEAVEAVGTWLGFKSHLGCRLGTAAAAVRTCAPTNGVTFHVVKLSGGGFVITSSDTEDEPILAFSDSDDFVESEANPLWTMLRRDLAARATSPRLHAVRAAFARTSAVASAVSTAAEKWSLLLPLNSANGLLCTAQASSGKATLSDVRVAPLLETKWNQMQDSYYSNRGDPCYNYYTPNNYPCGCVATAGAQIMRYHKHPTAAVTPGTYVCRVEVGKDWIDDYHYYPIYESRNLTMQGGIYDWSQMLAVPADGTTLAQRQAIGKLTSDIGISCLASYCEGGTSAGDYMLARRLPELFGYANAVAAVGSGLDPSFVRRVLISNLDAKLPVVVGVTGSEGGHAVVADGYGYSMTTFYTHVNMGYAGLDDAWYAPPDVAEYTAVDSMVYNIYPTGSAGGVILSGRILSSAGAAVAGADVSISGDAAAMATTDAKGIYAFILQPGSYVVSSGTASEAVTLVANIGMRVTDNGYYYETPAAEVNNVCNFDLVISDTPDPAPDPTPDPAPTPDPEDEGEYALYGHDTIAASTVNATVANTFDGMLCREGTLVGTVQVKIAKAGKNGNAKLTATITPVGEKKTTVSGNFDAMGNMFSANAKDGTELYLVIGADGLYGTWGDCEIEGSRNRYSSKEADDKAAVAAAGEWIGAYALVWDDENAAGNVLSVTIAKKGAVKISGTLGDGTAVSASTTMLIGADRCCIPVAYAKKGVSLAFSIWLDDADAEPTSEGVSVVGLDDAVFGKAGNLADMGVFTLDAAALGELLGDDETEVLTDYIPDGAEILPSGKKWIVMPDEKGKAMPAGKLVWDKTAGEINEEKSKIDGYNVSGLKLTFTEKTGTFKGTFKAYTIVRGALKNTTVNVSGVVIDGIGYGTASIKKLGSMPVMVE